MNILNRKRKVVWNTRLVVGLFVGALMLVLFFRVVPPHTLRGFALTLARPVWQARLSASVAAGGVFGVFASKVALERENALLYEELQKTQLILMRARVALRENRNLKSLLGRAGEYEYTLAWVLARPADTPYDTLIIDAGSVEGVQTGDRVFSEALVALGTVAEVFGRTSRIALFSSPGTETGVVFPESGLVATARGEGGGNFVVRVLEDEMIVEGTPVVLPGVSPTTIGVVHSVERVRGDVFMTVRFRTPVNLSTVLRVLVEKDTVS
ncbi:rod shape-determining protein MreC [Candidatus Wolfebacteria bacterium]|nr:rod shape-determining protein MreC [Candidatus Wolfebacteria bacterium]